MANNTLELLNGKTSQMLTPVTYSYVRKASNFKFYASQRIKSVHTRPAIAALGQEVKKKNELIVEKSIHRCMHSKSLRIPASLFLSLDLSISRNALSGLELILTIGLP